MTLDTDALRTLLCERLCEEVRVEQRPDGALMLRTHFAFPDATASRYMSPSQLQAGFDCQTAGTHSCISATRHDVDSFLDGTRGMILERIMGETGLRWSGDRGVLCVDTAPERLPETIFAFGQALTRVYDLTLLSRSNVGSTFYDDLADLLFSYVDEAQIERDFLPDVPNADAYPVDYRIEGKSDVPAFPLWCAEPR